MEKPPKKSEYEQAWHGHWFKVERPLFIACCDCGLIHSIEIRVGGSVIKDFEMRLKEERRHTGQLRRHQDFPCRPTRRKKRANKG